MARGALVQAVCVAAAVAVAVCGGGGGAAAAADGAGRKNVLMIVVDDLRPNLGAYGHGVMKTPNIDRLAIEGLVFTRAYVQYSFCAPSRNSFMTGRRPDRTRDWNFIDHFREPSVGQNWTSMPEHFKNNGYLTLGAGKLFHVGLPPAFDVPRSWSHDRPYVSPAQCDAAGKASPLVECPAATSACEDTDAIVKRDKSHFCVYDESKLKLPLYDRITANTTIANLRYAKAQGKNFFIGCGFHRPHLPFASPQQFYDLYDEADIRPPQHPRPPIGMPLVAWHEGNFNNTFESPCPPDDAVRFRHAYYGAISYMDSLVGQVLDELDALGLTDSTVVTLWGDHGWQLGEHNLWRKMTNFELGVRVPLIVRAPWKTASVGKRTTALAEIVDFYRTYADLAGLPEPEAGVQGISLVPVLDDPPQTGTGPNKYAFSQFAKNNSRAEGSIEPWNNCARCTRQEIQYMGFTVRSDDWRYTEWLRWDPVAIKPIWDAAVGRELYNHTDDRGDDFDAFENVNLINASAAQPVVTELAAALRQQFQHDE